ncbi:MAG: VOC family protein [Rikenellaceae bacterium]
MKITSKLDHININVLNLERSISFYSEALGLTELRRLKGEGFELVYLGDGLQNVAVELTWLADREEPYELGDNETHLCFRVSGDYDEIREFHRSKGWVCYENHDMGLYFINDPDDYWIEVLPTK